MLITKGELLTALGEDGNKFTAFMLDPASFGVQEPDLSKFRVAKQKLDWTASIETDLPEIAQLIALMRSLGIFSDKNIADILSVNGSSNYIINVLAQDNITDSNIYGAVQVGASWRVRVDFVNQTSGEVFAEDFVFDAVPGDQLRTAIDDHIKTLRAR
jgi:hypothetical protein